MELNVTANLLNIMLPLPFSWWKNCLGNINKFPKWRVLHKARPNWDTYHSSYNSDFWIHKWDNKFWGSYSMCRGFNSCSQHSLLASIINMSPKNGACFDLQENPIFEPQKKWMTVSFYCYQIHTSIFDLICSKHSLLFWYYSRCSPNWIFPKDSFPLKCHAVLHGAGGV